MTTDRFMQDLPVAINVLPRTRLRPTFRYTVETRAPNGNYVTSMAMNDRASAIAQAAYCRDSLKQEARVVDEWA